MAHPIVRTFHIGEHVLTVTVPNVRARGGFTFYESWTGPRHVRVPAAIEEEGQKLIRGLLSELIELRRGRKAS